MARPGWRGRWRATGQERVTRVLGQEARRWSRRTKEETWGQACGQGKDGVPAGQRSGSVKQAAGSMSLDVSERSGLETGEGLSVYLDGVWDGA